MWTVSLVLKVGKFAGPYYRMTSRSVWGGVREPSGLRGGKRDRKAPRGRAMVSSLYSPPTPTTHS